jgi:CDGSH-type Zn-finger protein
LPAIAVPGIAAAGGTLTVTPRPNGPIKCEGALTLSGTDGRSTFANEAFLCRCGASGKKPYCDGTHKKIGFTA